MILTWDIIRRTIEVLWIINIAFAVWTVFRSRRSVVAGYYPCHNAEDVIKDVNYDPVADLKNTPDSVFCAHGAGFPVPWNEVPAMAHYPYRKQVVDKERG